MSFSFTFLTLICSKKFPKASCHSGGIQRQKIRQFSSLSPTPPFYCRAGSVAAIPYATSQRRTTGRKDTKSSQPQLTGPAPRNTIRSEDSR